MNNNRVTVRYARALVDLAKEKNELSGVDLDIRIFFKALEAYPGFYNFIVNPGHGSMQKYANVETLFKPSFQAMSLNFIKMVFSNNREKYLKDICRNIIEMIRIENNMITAHLEMALPIDETLNIKIKQKFESQMKKEIEMTSSINNELIGGFIFTIDGYQYDASIASRLKTISKQLQLNK